MNPNKDKKVLFIILSVMFVVLLIIFLLLFFSNESTSELYSILSLVPVITIFFVSIIFLLVIIKAIKKYKQEKAYFAKNPNARKEYFIDPESIKYEELNIKDIKRIDNTIVMKAFNEYFNALFEIFEIGYYKLNADILKNAVNNTYYEDLKIRFSIKKNNKKPIYNIQLVSLKDPSITKIYKESNNIYIEVYTYVNIEKNTGVFSTTFKMDLFNTYFKSDELFRVVLVKGINNISKCPNCNAQLDNYDKCSYCGSSINQLANKYKICDVNKLAVLNYRYDDENKKWVPQRY